MRTVTGSIAILLIQLLSACDKGLPVAPTPPSPSAAAPVPSGPAPITGEKWNLTTTITSMTGPDQCVRDYAAKLPVASDWLLTLARSGDSLHLFASDISDPEYSQEYTATVAGAEFSGSGRPSGYFACGESRIYRAENHLAGRFSADRSRMTADEELVIYLPSGDVVTYHTEWSATKQ